MHHFCFIMSMYKNYILRFMIISRCEGYQYAFEIHQYTHEIHP